jgi:hypothetical protein
LHPCWPLQVLDPWVNISILELSDISSMQFSGCMLRSSAALILGDDRSS